MSETRHSILEEPIVELAPPLGIHRCLEHIWQTFQLRARLFLLEQDALVLRDCVGNYSCCPELGLRVHAGSLVTEIFQTGKPVNLTGSNTRKERPHTLPEPVLIKAVIPLKSVDALKGRLRSLGVLVVDTGDPCKLVNDRDFRYLNIIGMLMSEVLTQSMLIKQIRIMNQEKREMAEEVSHIFRNRFAVIGGFALRLTKALDDPTLRQYARIILKETAKGEKGLKRWNRLHKRGKWEDESGYLC